MTKWKPNKADQKECQDSDGKTDLKMTWGYWMEKIALNKPRKKYVITISKNKIN